MALDAGLRARRDRAARRSASASRSSAPRTACSASWSPTWCARSARSRSSAATIRAPSRCCRSAAPGRCTRPTCREEPRHRAGASCRSAPGILCAQGLIVSDLRGDFVRTAVTPLIDAQIGETSPRRIDELKTQAERWFDTRAGVRRARRQHRSRASMLRYVGQNFELAIAARRMRARSPDAARSARALLRRARARLRLPQSGRPDRDRQLPPDRASARASAGRAPGRARATAAAPRAGIAPQGLVRAPMQAAGHAGLRARDAARPATAIAGPAVIEQLDATTLLLPGDRATRRSARNL